MKGKFRLIIIIFLLAIVNVLIFSVLLRQSQIAVGHSYMNRYDSAIIADELRQSSDDLTKFIRMYAVTGDIYYRNLYWQVLNIRNGTYPRPEDYQSIYWDLLLPQKELAPDIGVTKSLREKIEKKGITSEEITLLDKAENESNKLVETEMMAIRAIENELNDSDVEFKIEGESNRDFAIRILNNNDYNTAKSRIMGPILEFYTKLNRRTEEVISVNNMLAEKLLFLAIISLTLLLVVLFILSGKLFNNFRNIEILLEEKVKSRTKELQNKNMEFVQTYKRLIQSEKMAAIGGLVAGVAHEINTPVGLSITISSYIVDETERICSNLQKDNISLRYLKEYFDNMGKLSNLILKNMDKVRQLIIKFKSISVNDFDDDGQQINLKDFINSTINSNRLILRNIDVEIYQNNNINIYTFPDIIYQIILNLFENSIFHAYGREKGKVRIEIMYAGSNVEIKYTDFGRGIPIDNIDKIFEPFYTTDRNPSRHGLGLNIVYNYITQKLKGSIECTSEIGKGTNFLIKLPLINEA